MTEDVRQKVLIVDDDALNRQVLCDLLKTDCQVILAKNGEQALEKAAQHLPDLILLDVLMPDMDGYEVLQRLKADHRTSPISVIFITGMDTPEDEARAFQAGISDYITKPYHVPVVQARIALHLRLARHYHLLESLANIDALTEIPNRRHFDRILQEECRRASRSGQTLSLAMLDVDFFKQYNDHYGHAMGDRTLRAIATALRTGLHRPADLCARYGGEEFVLILPDTDHGGAITVADNIRASIEQLAIPHEHSAVSAYVTISVGMASCAGEQMQMTRPEELLALADSCLYQAKAHGRNRVEGTG